MSRPRKSAKDRHKPGKMIRVPLSLHERLKKAAERNASDPSEEARRAIREYLERMELWPPPGRS